MPPVAEIAAPTEERVLVSQPADSTLFMARRDSLRLVKRPIRAIRGAEGEVLDQTQGETIAFQDGVLRVPHEGQMMLTNGEMIDAQDVLAFLERHRFNGDWQEGFWRVDPVAPPLSKRELDALMELAIALDAEGLRSLIEQEEAGWKRADLLESARGTLERVEVSLAAQMQATDEAIARARAEGEAAAKKETA